MMKYALVMDAPVAVRYPRGEAYSGLKEFRAPVELGKAELFMQREKYACLPSAAWLSQPLPFGNC